MFSEFLNTISDDLTSEKLKGIKSKYGSDLKGYTQSVYEKSVFTDEARFKSFWTGASDKKIVKTLKKDPVVGLCSPFLLFTRAVSLSGGLIAGSVKFCLQQEKNPNKKIDATSYSR